MPFEALDLAAEEVVVLSEVALARQLVEERRIRARRQANSVSTQVHGAVVGGDRRGGGLGLPAGNVQPAHAGRRAEGVYELASGQRHGAHHNSAAVAGSPVE